MNTALPVVVIGAGPVGLAAAAHLLERGLTPLVLEAGDSPGAGMLRWAHVRMFSPWEFNVDRAARKLLEQQQWQAPNPVLFPTGGELVENYLKPLAATPDLHPHLHFGARVLAVTKQRRDRMKDRQRNDAPFVVRFQDTTGEREVLAQAVIDASGTIEHPNPLGANGLPAMGERALQSQVAYGIPDVFGKDRERYAGKRVLVVGSGHSAFNVLSDLARLSGQVPGMRIEWAIRRPSLEHVLGGGENDQLEERGKLGLTIKQLVAEGTLQVTTDFHLERLERTAEGIVAHGDGKRIAAVDEIVGSTGFRPEVELLAELRILLDLGTQAPLALAPLIDPNLHSCGSVRPHGAEELKHPDANVYIVGMKSYGRAPTFLLMTGYEQVRSVVAAIAGDWDAARRVELVLPETGVCIAGDTTAAPAAAGCPVPASAEAPAPAVASCGGAAAEESNACCADDETTKAAGKAGCGCGPAPVPPPRKSCCAS